MERRSLSNLIDRRTVGRKNKLAAEEIIVVKNDKSNGGVEVRLSGKLAKQASSKWNIPQTNHGVLAKNTDQMREIQRWAQHGGR